MNLMWLTLPKAHTLSTKLSTTRFSPALSKRMVRLLPSTAVTLPLPNFWWMAGALGVKTAFRALRPAMTGMGSTLIFPRRDILERIRAGLRKSRLLELRFLDRLQPRLAISAREGFGDARPQAGIVRQHVVEFEPLRAN